MGQISKFTTSDGCNETRKCKKVLGLPVSFLDDILAIAFADSCSKKFSSYTRKESVQTLKLAFFLAMACTASKLEIEQKDKTAFTEPNEVDKRHENL